MTIGGIHCSWPLRFAEETIYVFFTIISFNYPRPLGFHWNHFSLWHYCCHLTIHFDSLLFDWICGGQLSLDDHFEMSCHPLILHRVTFVKKTVK